MPNENLLDMSKQSESTKVSEHETVEFAKLVEPVVPLVTSFLEAKSEQLKAEQKLHLRQLEIEEKKLEIQQKKIEIDADSNAKLSEFAKFKFKSAYWLIAAVIIGMFFLASALIWSRNEVDLAMRVLSHMMTLIMGFIGGIGWQASKSNQEK